MFEDYIYTNIGYFNEKNSHVLSSMLTIDDNNEPYAKLHGVPLSSIDIIIAKQSPIRPQKPYTLLEVMQMLYALSTGQRRLTPAWQNNFIDRPSKTFFSERYVFSLENTVKHLVNIDALFNYIQGSYWTKDVTVVERLYREYRYIVGQLAYMLMTCEANKNDTFDDENELPQPYVCDSVIKNVEAILRDEENALAFVNGIAFICCYRDHTATNKDMKSTKIRKWLDRFKKDMFYLEENPEKLFSKSNIARVIKIGKFYGNEFWLVKDNTEDVINIIEDKETNSFIYENEKIPAE